MAEIKHTDLAQWLNTTPFDELPQVYLVHGDAFLCRKIFDAVLDVLLPKEQRSLGYDFLDGDEARLPVIVQRLSTYSMMQDRLVVAAKEVPLFSTDRQSGMTPEDFDALQHLMEKGIPAGHYLLITTPQADRRRTLFKAFREYGLVVDCTVAKGSRKADKTEQTALMRTLMEQVLAPVQKGIDGRAFTLLTDLVGFDPATLVDNLEKLVAFIGDRPGITATDVQSVVERTRKDAIFEFTNAVADRNVSSALFYFHALTREGAHPLQFLKALGNQIRKITRVKDFVDSCRAPGQMVWHPGQSYQQFSRITLPAVVKADELMVKKLEEWEDQLPPQGESKPSGKKKKAVAKKKKTASDLAMAPNPKNPYPIYQTFLKSDNFTQKELIHILMALGELDYQLKSSNAHPHILLENLIVRICTGMALT
ncbi:DNA polymerase III, delta subunit [Desulfocicer vacuolatum DSM 3385]|uniref:DNA polymerase III subunit delta n=1 Tax=Desulfocicer vacuolatum DSM 3385 TaxID=1121400 RepID=A0A1W1Z7C2_9BACT|nr:hypothetical protein [Desulfocicer vacuolatum]SMC44340.1 DNA polymerase III, delta subunit [Desulfocicer vacuolatum DSM 3385]